MTKEDFKKIYTQGIEDASKELASFPWENKRAYAGWLAQTYYFVSNSTRILSLAAGFAKPTEDEIHKRMIGHLKEETGHDILALKDIEAMGFKIEDFPEMVETKNFYENQFYTIQNKGSASLMGWIFFLEGIADHFGETAVQRTRVHGPKTTKFLRLHAEEDEDHIESAFALFDHIPESSIEEIVYNFKNSSRIYCSVLRQVKEECGAFEGNGAEVSMY